MNEPDEGLDRNPPSLEPGVNSTAWHPSGPIKPLQILAALRAAERTKAEHDRFDTFYRVYITALVSLVSFYFALGLVDKATADPAGLRWAAVEAPLWVGVIAALTVAAGVRSGVNGGPLALVHCV